MTESDKPYDLIRWDVPFADADLPGLTLLADPGGLVTVVVAPQGINRYPKYRVEFDGDVIAYL